MYCYSCFRWFVEEQWNQHCQWHLESITSKRCASITHCSTLVRPAFCPFCLGDQKLPAQRRLASWTREAKLWSHLGPHLQVARWPLTCPHPLCDLQLNDERLFLFHLRDTHDLRISQYLQNQNEKSIELVPFISWKLDETDRRRKRPALAISDTEKSSLRSMIPAIPEAIQTVSPQEVLKDQSIGQQTLPSLTYGHLTFSQTKDGHFAHNNDSASVSADPELPLPCEDALFSQYLRSRSPSCFSDDLSPAVPIASFTCRMEEGQQQDQGRSDPGQIEEMHVKRKKPRITLRMGSPPSKPKSITKVKSRSEPKCGHKLKPGRSKVKVSLRLSQPNLT